MALHWLHFCLHYFFFISSIFQHSNIRCCLLSSFSQFPILVGCINERDANANANHHQSIDYVIQQMRIFSFENCAHLQNKFLSIRSTTYWENVCNLMLCFRKLRSPSCIQSKLWYVTRSFYLLFWFHSISHLVSFEISMAFAGSIYIFDSIE